MSRLSRSVRETERIAAELAGTLVPGQCLALHGELGAGKTQFVRGLVRGLGGDAARVCSPTFVLLNIYPTSGMTVYHLDAYRVACSEDFEGIGFPELLEQGGIVVVEWAERVTELIPRQATNVRIEIVDERRRRIEIESPSPQDHCPA